MEEGGGGGGGWYGGGGGFIGGGGGGSGYGPPGTAFATGVRSGDGLVTVTYTEPSIANLIKSVVDLDLPLAAEATLLKPLIAAADGLDSGNVTRACTQLGLFIIDVHDLRGAGTIPAAAADQLVAEAEDVRDSLNCDATGVACAGQEATIVGTDSAETLRGTTGDDVIVAGGGGDTVVALGGDDLICGSGGNDEIRGKGGDDTLRGGSGKDELRGGGGSNRCRGGKGSDSKHHC